MMKSFTLLSTVFTLLSLTPHLSATTLEVRTSGGTYNSLESAAAVAQPGDTILFRAGTYNGGEYVENLRGRSDARIHIMAAPGEEVIVQGGTNAWQLSDPAWLYIAGFTIQGQTGNGLNIDDAGTFDTPAHHIIIENCHWHALNASGNNDQLKMSGVDSFTVRNCTFSDGSAGGSMIDMVGCHFGVFEGNLFERAGSNCIQSKGGTRYIRIERNRFFEGGERALNIGGSTGAQFFRPQSANYEAINIGVYCNLFTGSDAPIAFVGAVNCEVMNNTIYLPNRWVIRILQETTTDGFLECGQNAFWNNLVVVDDDAAGRVVNIGPNTRPETFLFNNNLWFNTASSTWTGPGLPVPETGELLNQNPQLIDPANGDFRVASTSPAIAAGAPLDYPVNDFFGVPFSTPRSIGAVEGNPGTLAVPHVRRLDLQLSLW